MSPSRLLTPLRGIVLLLTLTLPALALILAAPAAAQTMTTDDMVRRGYAYRTGDGVAQSDSEALRWYRAAAEGGNALGMNNLGFMYENGRGVAQSDSEAVRWFRAAAAGGDEVGMANLGASYDSGRGVSRNAREAATWFLQAERLGHRGFRERVGDWHPETRIEVQRQLRDAGLYTGALDGSFGPASLVALRAYAGG